MNLFVYGTHAPGEPNEHILKKLNGSWLKGVVKGKLFSSGWGAAYGFPGIVLTPEGDDVHGLIFSSSELDDYWQTLDEFEGEGYQRVTTNVQLSDGQSIQAYIYELTEKSSNSQ